MDHKELFLNVMRDAGLPTTLEDFQNEWEKHVENSDFAINNESPFSPFFRLQQAIMAQPAKQMVDTLAGVVMPNSFVMLATGPWLDKKGEERKLPRLAAVKATGNITFTRIDSTAALSIPAGSIIESYPINGRVYRVITKFNTEFAPGETEQTAVVEAENTGKAYNLSAGYYVKLLPAVEGVTVTNKSDWLTTPGQDTESDENYQIRQQNIFGTLGDYHVDSVYRSMLNTFPGISAQNIAFDKTAPRGPGSVDIYVYLDVGQISQSVIDEMNNFIAAGNHGHGDDVLIFAMPTQAFDFTVTIYQHPNTADIKAEAEAFIRAAFRQNDAYKNTRVKPNELFSFSVLRQELHNEFSALKHIDFTIETLFTEMKLPTIGNLVMQHG
ncbi:baseplate J/gp47 family protein [Pseudoalteromonas ruthenica]|uniref:baseplate J/gp47 family protein n=1 Tax=Pseudoalteromonas ruthenica TaxID=151081 RepID=UPI00110B60BE|nr:baseplate J/gp47 family protein [Pseudoalteromonas ruthenica]TMO97543.1 hypothetical protein CWC07_13765 [Pseudoalteromonas ruthenica]